MRIKTIFNATLADTDEWSNLKLGIWMISQCVLIAAIIVVGTFLGARWF